MQNDRHEHHDARLLAIDDSELIHQLLRGRLRNERIQIHAATNAADGLQLARVLLPDVILLDIDMPDRNGFDIIQDLKADPTTHDIPVIFFSSDANVDTKIRGFELGAVDFVTKPFEVAELKARVNSAIRLSRLVRMLAQRAQVDGLTGLWNRAYFDWRLGEEVAIAERHCNDLALIFCDLDRFKGVNDTYGHPFGDQVLERFGLLLAHGRKGDIACRYGGEEFGIILPETNAQEAANVAERLLVDLRSMTWRRDPGLAITASFGITDLRRVHPRTTAALVESADRALYAAKARGRNCVAVSDDPPQARLTA
ncbi:MAG: diguanylate cyclase [Phycisphaerales bacterium]|nr:diguanylate cyclase [Phycisphaerales bacterium]